MDTLSEMGFVAHEQLVVAIADAIWRSIDWNTPLWRNAGVTLYDRFESRVRAASRERSLSRFTCRLARKCGVQMPQIHGALIGDINAVNDTDASKALHFAQTQSGLVVAAVRALKDIRKEARTHG